MAAQLFSSPFLIGLLIGFGGSAAGALVDTLDSRRKAAASSYGGLMLITAGLVNSLLGIAAIVYSLLATGKILTALIVGLGVLVGFAVGFLLIAGLWIWLGNKKGTA
jgi:hypothetical protein